MKKLLLWLDDRTGYKELLHEALYEKVPGGARWRYVWGSTLVFTFALQMITGIFLWAAYSPSAQTAWESVYFIQYQMPLGNIVRGIHHFAAQAMVVLMAIHLIQVVIDGAYKAPREVNFWLGLVLMQIVLALGLTGYLLPWDQKGYYATKVSTNIMGATPVIGQQLQHIVQGGPEYGHHTLTRFFALHAGVLPALLVAFLGLHIYVFRRHGITVHDPKHKPDTTFWPDQVLKDAVACLGVLAVVMGLAIFKGAELSSPANPAEAYSAARPEWYFLFLFRFLKFEVVANMGMAVGAIYIPGLIMTVIGAMPIIAWWKNGHKFNVIFIWMLMVAVAVLTGMAFYKDANDPSFIAAVEKAEADAHRVKELAEQPTRIPVQGASFLLQNDPYTQGPRLFATHCASCHRWDGHDGTGKTVTEKKDGKVVDSVQTAADLAGIGSREWMRRAIVDFSGMLKPIENAQWYKKGKEAGDLPIDLSPDAGDMVFASNGYKKLFADGKNKEVLDAVLEYFAKEADHPGVEIDEDLAKRGQVLVSGEAEDLTIEFSACYECHSLEPIDYAELASDADLWGPPPMLAGYGSREWLTKFILKPSYHYGASSPMPGYDGKMTEREIDLLVRWMIGDYVKPKAEANAE